MEIIADLSHVYSNALWMAKRAFAKEAVYFVSHSMPIFCSEEKDFFIGDNSCAIVDGKIPDKEECLVGSEATMADAVFMCWNTNGRGFKNVQ